MSAREPDNQPLDYRSSGVDIDAGEELVRRIRPVVRQTHRQGVLGGIGGFGALFELPLGDYRNPVLVSGTDGVGTKLKLASDLDRHDTVGIDLVAMCVNDILVTGAEPLYFLDYFATGRLDVDLAETVVRGIAEGCRLAGCALAGGETAEMPGMYHGNDYDLAGFAVGIVEKDRMLNPADVQPGQVLLGLASSGPHSNGFSLIRRILEQSGASPDAPLGAASLGEALLAPTRIYAGSILGLLGSVPVAAAAHVTGGGISENLPRMLPDGIGAVIDLSAWDLPEVFRWLQAEGGIASGEMLRTFNCGIGMVLAVDAGQADRARSVLEDHGETVISIGRTECGESGAGIRFEHAW